MRAITNRLYTQPRVRPQVGVSAVLVAVVVSLVGCASWRGGDPVVDNPMVEYYRKVAERIAVAEDSTPEPTESLSLGDGRRLIAPTPEERRPISLAEAIQTALANNTIIRQNAQFLSPQNPLLQNPDGVSSVFDPDIQNSGVIFGNRGTEAALSDFDPRFSSSVTVGRDSTGQNNFLQQGAVLNNNNGQFNSSIDQQLLTGGIISLSHNWTYTDSNAPQQIFPQTYAGILGAQFRQPLWSGAGREVTSIAGPAFQQARGFSYVNQGVVIARINNRLSEIDVEENLQNLLREVGDVYWDLYQAFNEFGSEQATAAVAKQMWDEVRGKFEADLIGEAEEAQSEDAYHEATARADHALAGLLQTETRLRRLLGLPIEDGKILFPMDEPQSHEIHLNRSACLFEAMTNRLELRRQKTNIHGLELQLRAAQNLANPRLDFVGGGSLNGFGQNLMSGNAPDGITQEGFNNAYTSLFRSRETSWNLGFEYTIPLWLRSQRAQVNQLEYRLVKARSALALQEDEITRELYAELQTMQRWYTSLQTNRRRVLAARRRAAATMGAYRDAGNTAVDPVLRAEMSLNHAKNAYYRSLSEYNKSLRNLLYRVGRLLTIDGIELLNSDGLPVQSESIPLYDEAPSGKETSPIERLPVVNPIPPEALGPRVLRLPKEIFDGEGEPGDDPQFAARVSFLDDSPTRENPMTRRASFLKPDDGETPVSGQWESAAESALP